MTSDLLLASRGARGLAGALLAWAAASASAATHDLGAWRVEVKEDSGAWVLSAAGGALLECAPGAGPVEVAATAGSLALTPREGPLLRRVVFEPNGNRLVLTHEFSCRAASRVQVIVDDEVRLAAASLRVPAGAFLGKPFSFTTVQVKEVAPYTATAPLGEKGELADPTGAPGKGFFSISAFAMATDKAAFALRLSRDTKNPYSAKGKAEVPRPAGAWILRSQLKSQPPSLGLDFGDALDALTVDAWRIEVEMTPK